MTDLVHFVDPTSPGISGRSLVERAVSAVHGFCGRRDLVGLDRETLRDIGLDRNAA